MTKEDAIKILNTVLCFGKCDCSKDEIEECLKMAIKALQQQPSEGEKVIRISKGTLKARTGKYVIYDVEWLKEHFNTTEAKLYGQPSERTETHECDCIDRKEAVDALKQQAEDMVHWSERYTEQRKGILIAINIVSDLSSVTPQPKEEPQQKTGHWIWCASSHKCSNCGGYVCFSHKKLLKYCPNCGARMEVQNEHI